MWGLMLLALFCSVGGVLPDTEVSFRMSEENTSGCQGKSKKQLKEVEDAQLAAHRCMIRDVAVRVSEPEDFLADTIFPSHIVVPRCEGVCVHSSGLTCHPRKTPKKIQHQVVLYATNGTQVCRTVSLEHHKGPCRCSCHLSSADCSSSQVFSPSQCRCSCPHSANTAKFSCTLDTARVWDDRQCSCVCPTPCPPGHEQDPHSCSCSPILTSCSLSSTTLTGVHPARVATCIGVAAIAIVTVTIITSLYCMMSRKRPYIDLRTDQSTHSLGHPRTPQTAYSITINQSQRSLAHLDEDSPLPLTFHQDKTRL